MSGDRSGRILNRTHSVYRSCPHGSEFRNVRHGLMFAILATGHRPLCDFDNPFPFAPHVPRLGDNLGQCRYSMHDCTCCDTDKPNEFGRFNMSIELGMALFERHRTSTEPDFHEIYIQIPERHSYLQFLARLNNGFAYSYASEFDALRQAFSWLSEKPTCSMRPRIQDIQHAWEAFLAERPTVASTNGIDEDIRQDELCNLILSVCRKQGWWRDPPWMRFDVFMAYNWEDKQAVHSIATKIKEAGFKPWIDSEQVAPGTPFAKQIEIAIPQSNATAI